MYMAEILPSGVNGWDREHSKRIRFYNKLRFYRFVEYYSGKHDVLIKVLVSRNNGNDWFWTRSFVKGREIWNIW